MVVTRNRAVYINGHRIENVISVDIEQNAMDPTRMTLEVVPTSVMYGDIPSDTIEDLHSQSAGKDVDISKAMENARLRREGKLSVQPGKVDP